jgi:hypothetical protein
MTHLLTAGKLQHQCLRPYVPESGAETLRIVNASGAWQWSYTNGTGLTPANLLPVQEGIKVCESILHAMDTLGRFADARDGFFAEIASAPGVFARQQRQC